MRPKSDCFLLASNLIAIDKNNGASLRPIAIGEYFYKLAATRALMDVKKEISKLLLPIQHGVAVPNGVEHVIHQTQHALENEKVALTVDMKNAFNSISRAEMFAELYKHQCLRSIWKLVHFAYSNSSLLYVRNENHVQCPLLLSSQGVKQGDPLSAFLFSLTIQSSYVEASNSVKNISMKCIMDDCTIVGNPEDILPVFNKFCEKVSDIGLEVQPHKSKLIHYNDTPLDKSLLDSLEALKIEIVKDTTILLGSPIGSDCESIDKTASEIIMKNQMLFDCLSSDHLSIQEAYTIIRLSTNTLIRHLARTVRPDAMIETAQLFDQTIRDIMMNKLKWNTLSPPQQQAAWAQMQLPMRLGGIGLTSTTNILHASYLASLIRSHEWSYTKNQTSFDTADKNTMLSPKLSDQIDKCISKIQDQIPNTKCLTSLPNNVKDFKNLNMLDKNSKNMESRRLQGTISRQIHKIEYHKAPQIAKAKYLETKGSPIKDTNFARRIAVAAKGAYDWLMAGCSNKDYILTDRYSLRKCYDPPHGPAS